MDSGWSLHDQETNPHGSQVPGDHSGDDDGRPGYSDYGDSVDSSGFTSIASYVLRHAHQEGRRYQSFRLGSYPLPNDSIEQEREEMKHLMIKRLFDGHDYLAPIGNNPQKIIDIGTGIGLWAIDVADTFPGAQVVGVDITPIQSPVIPHNVMWRIDDIQNTEWAPPYSGADFIHMRSVISTLSRHEDVVESAFRNLKPGGWIEFQELWCHIGCDDGTMRADHPMLRFTSLLRQHFAPLHQWNIDLAQSLPQLLQRVGFTDVNIRRHKIPIGAWARDQKQRELGLFMSKHVLWQFIKAVLVKWSDMGLASRIEADSLEADIRTAFDDPEIHTYMPWVSVWAQKP